MFDSLRSVLRFRKLEFDPKRRRLNACADVSDLRRLAKKRLPAGVFDYIDGGAEDELTLVRNERAYQKIGFFPRVLRDVSAVDPTCVLLGRPTPLPLVLAPTGFTRIADPPGELAVARAAARLGIPCTLSTMGTRSIEEVAEASDSVTWGAEGERRLWFQVYVWKDRELLADMIQRCAAARYEALVVTVDTPRLGRRERDVRRGMELPPKLGLGTIVDGMLRPSWTWQFLRNDPIVFANVTTSSSGADSPDGSSAIVLADHLSKQFDPSLSWDDIDWFRSQWDGKLIVKGVQTVADALRCVERGVDAVCLSNHGGRQLDGAPAPIDLVAPCREAVGDNIEIIADGGVRRGSDMVKARALGADAVMAGRPYLYALGTAGELGVDWLLDFFDDGMRRTMALCGTVTVGDITPDLVTRLV
ncbi:MAG: alpha-hydroxy-acid oxidizing protein [Acidimicrobiaceae bacterium]|nr:alpha-hydroxy-acid oxidizing protein [Acidimicrobiaceae bacterium]MYD05443.1 alpha-hydroxy-acid oxidizing protein [Acidimicrobiaceae bacterium]MYI59902.1 alpha-hydroxy-acid oxidizing protein [Acidimicrobiaceae bacterium]